MAGYEKADESLANDCHVCKLNREVCMCIGCLERSDPPRDATGVAKISKPI